MGLDFDSILKGLKRYVKRESPISVTEQTLVARANEMARWGYKHTPVTLRALERYLTGYAILFTGRVGVGKTFFFKCLNRTGADIAIISMHECYLWPFDELSKWLTDNRDREVLVDDIGSNERSNSYGTKYEALKYILSRRLDSPARTHFTTNGTPDELEKVYDFQVVDRLFELADSFVFDRTDSLREPRPNVKAVREIQDKSRFGT